MTGACVQCDCELPPEQVTGKFCGECGHPADDHATRDTEVQSTCANEDCECDTRYPLVESERFCPDCGHRRGDHPLLDEDVAEADAKDEDASSEDERDDVDELSEQPTQQLAATTDMLPQRRQGLLKPGTGACEDCACESFEGGRQTRFCGSCGHERDTHVIAIAVAKTADVPGGGHSTRLDSWRADIATLPPIAYVATIVLCVVLCSSAFFVGRGLGSGGQARLDRLRADVRAMEDKVSDARREEDDVRRDLLEDQTTGVAAQKSQQQAAARRKALQKDIDGLRRREQNLRQTLAEANAYNGIGGE